MKGVRNRWHCCIFSDMCVCYIWMSPSLSTSKSEVDHLVLLCSSSSSSSSNSSRAIEYIHSTPGYKPHIPKRSGQSSNLAIRIHKYYCHKGIQGVTKSLKTGQPMNNHLENVVAHIKMNVAQRDKWTKIYIKCYMLTVQEIDFVHCMVVHRPHFPTIGWRGPNLGRPGL